MPIMVLLFIIAALSLVETCVLCLAVPAIAEQTDIAVTGLIIYIGNTVAVVAALGVQALAERMASK